MRSLSVFWQDSSSQKYLMVIWIKFTHPHPFCVHWLLNDWCSFLPSPFDHIRFNFGFMALTLQIPMKYSSLLHQALLLPPYTSTAGLLLLPRLSIHSCCAISLLLPSNILDTYWPVGLISQCHIILLFHNFHEILMARVLKLVCHSLLQQTMFCQTLSTVSHLSEWPIWVFSLILLCNYLPTLPSHIL